MKSIILIICIYATVLNAAAQPNKQLPEPIDKPKSNLEIFSDKTGTMFKKDFLPITTIKNVEFEVLKITDLSTNETNAGLRLHTAASSLSGVSTSGTAYLDADELAGLIKAVDYIIANVASTTAPETSVEYNFESRSGFKFGIFNVAQVFSSKKKWSIIMKLDKYYSTVAGYFNNDDLPKIKDALEQAKNKL